VVLARLELPGYTLFATAVAPLRSLLDKSAAPLATSRPFARARDLLPTPTANYAYLDNQGWRALLGSLQGILPENIDTALQRIQAVGIETVTPPAEEAGSIRRGRFSIEFR